jgi:predicted DNA-binding WGR domain protein
VYDIQLAASSDGVTVKVSYGRRGGNQKVETKTPEGPVTQDAALKIAVSLLKSKIRGGYRPVDAGEKEPSTIMQAIEAVDTGLRPQLLSAVGDDPFEVADLLNSPVHAAQEKMDGERRMLMVGTALEVVGANRRGIAVPVPDGLSREVLAIGRLVTLDGEAMGEEFWAFDLLSLDGEDLRNSSFERRVALLQNLPFEWFSLKR